MARNPLNKADRERLAAARRELQGAVELCDRCERCGLDVQERKEVLAYLIDRLSALEQEFLGGAPASIQTLSGTRGPKEE